jgi:hypothetical protein
MKLTSPANRRNNAMSGQQARVCREKLEKAVKHIAYEVRLLEFTADRLQGDHASPSEPPEGDETNAFLESFLLHYRNLLVFLCPEGHQVRHSDDVVASDYLGEEKPKNVGRRDKLIDRNEKDRLDKLLAHITFHRERFIEERRTNWKTAQMRDAMLGEFRRFVHRKLSRHPHWKERFLREPGMVHLLADEEP